MVSIREVIDGEPIDLHEEREIIDMLEEIRSSVV